MPRTSFHIGCSGFYYNHWKGNFYPPDVTKKVWFEYYCSKFKTVELNTTFYHFPKPEVLQQWYRRSPGDFVFTVKAPRAITHYQKFVGSKALLTDFYSAVKAALKKKLGCVLFQLPRNIQFSDAKLEQIIETLNPRFTNAIEFRHASWWQQQVTERLGKKKITFCGVSFPGLSDNVVSNTEVLYYRMHGVPQLYVSPYGQDELKKTVAEIKKFKPSVAYIYFNNDAIGWAYRNAMQAIGIANGK